MIKIEELKKYAESLMFSMQEEEYETLQAEFEIIKEQMELIGKIEGIDQVEAMHFAVDDFDTNLRKDDVKNLLTKEEAFANVSELESGEVRVPKVVE